MSKTIEEAKADYKYIMPHVPIAKAPGLYISILEKKISELENKYNDKYNVINCTRRYDAEFEDVDCEHYELQEMPDDKDEKCHAGIGVENCHHCYKNKALYCL